MKATNKMLRAIGLPLVLLCGAIPLLRGEAFACDFLACYRPDPPVKAAPGSIAIGPTADLVNCRWKLDGKKHSKLTESGEVDPLGNPTTQQADGVHGKFSCAFSGPTVQSGWYTSPVTGTYVEQLTGSAQIPGGAWLQLLTARIIEPTELPTLGTLRDIHTVCSTDPSLPGAHKCQAPPVLDCRSYQDTAPGDAAQVFRLTRVGETAAKKRCDGGSNSGNECTINPDCPGGTCTFDAICSILAVDP